MDDLICIAVTLAFFVVSALYATACEKTLKRMETIIAAIIALLLFVYLLYAMLRPEKF